MPRERKAKKYASTKKNYEKIEAYLNENTPTLDDVGNESDLPEFSKKVARATNYIYNEKLNEDVGYILEDLGVIDITSKKVDEALDILFEIDKLKVEFKTYPEHVRKLAMMSYKDS
jgi:hypothetical protein